MNAVEAYHKFKNIRPEAYQVMKKLKQLRELGKKDSEIEEIIHSLKLPLGLHMFILGNFSDLMRLNYK